MRSLVLAPLLLLGGCWRVDGQIDCDLSAHSSVVLTVTDLDGGEPMSEVFATFTVDGGRSRDCESMGDGSFVCGWEVAGDLVVMAEAEYYLPADATVTVEADDCHVITEQVTLELELQAPG